MTMYPLRREDEVRPCAETYRDGLTGMLKEHPWDCRCDGTGQLGDPDAEMVIEVLWNETVGLWSWWLSFDPNRESFGAAATEAEAVKDAREVLRK